ncbi:MAG: hypothetical protein AAFW46_10900 [Pseudomonadota bacterium]
MSAPEPSVEGSGGFDRFLRSPLRLALAASLIVNVFLASAWLGRASQSVGAPESVAVGLTGSASDTGAEAKASGDSSSTEAGRGRSRSNRSWWVERFLRNASPELRALVEEAQDQNTGDFSSYRSQLRALGDERLKLLRSQPFDAEAFRRNQQASMDLVVQMRSMSFEAFAEVAERGDDAIRAELADLFEAQYRRWRERRRQREQSQTAPRSNTD